MSTKITNIIVILLLLIIVGFYAGQSLELFPKDLEVYVNEQKISSEVPLDLKDGQILIEGRALFDLLNIKADWDPDKGQLSGQKEASSLRLTMGQKTARLEGEDKQLSLAPKETKDGPMVPLRFVVEALGHSLHFERAERRAYIKIKNSRFPLYTDQGLSYIARTKGRAYQTYQDGRWQDTFIKGVNMGAGKPGHFPGQLAITKEEYLRWFSSISQMNADVIRVYTIKKPTFYNALHQYNQTADRPLYLMHGVWLNAEDILNIGDAYGADEKIKKDFIQDTRDLIDVIHGDKILPFKKGVAGGAYTRDVSDYVLGWILGIEWDPYFVEATNANNPQQTSFEGDYLYTRQAPPFETFLCQVGEAAVAYETEKYQMQRPLSFSNWPTTDMLDHPNEPHVMEDMAVVNTEHIKAKDSFKAGLFASYHIYPYYPDFLHYQKEYQEVKDPDGTINTYKAYLADLYKEHTIPLMVAEFGVPSSRGKAHEELHAQKNQGRHTEKEQGQIITGLLTDIHQEGYAGALIFSWQDEWFKRTWNTMDLDDPNRRPFWSNTQTNEQEFGLLAFDPGQDRSLVYVDGDLEDWAGQDPITTSGKAALYAQSDLRYLYLLIKDAGRQGGQTDDQETLYLALDTHPDQGNSQDLDRMLRFTRPTDFLIELKGKDDSRLLVDKNYDPHYYLYGEELEMIQEDLGHTVKNSGRFKPLYLALNRILFLPKDQRTIPFSDYETGKLREGIARPGRPDYDSLADFTEKDGHIEIRIPWQLLNVMDPSRRMIMDNFYEKNAIVHKEVPAVHLALAKKDPTASQTVLLNNFASYSWPTWETPLYHERLKDSYYLVKEAFQELESPSKTP